MPEEKQEPQTLDEVMDNAILDTSEQAKAEAETQKSNEAEIEAQEEETYTRIDPKTLPPELQPMHKSLLRDYTKKTQSIAQQRRELEKRQAEIEQLNQQLQTQLQQLQTQPQQQDVQEIPQGVSNNMNVEEYTAFMLSQIEERLNARERQLVEQQEQNYLEKAVREFEAADERLNPESPAYDKYMRTVVGEELDKELHEYQQEHGTVIGFDYQERTQDLIEKYEQHINEKAKSIANQKTQEAFKSAKRTAPMSIKGTKAPSKPTANMSLDDAIDAAFNL
jgi:hypothetical protein